MGVDSFDDSDGDVIDTDGTTFRESNTWSSDFFVFRFLPQSEVKTERSLSSHRLLSNAYRGSHAAQRHVEYYLP